MKNDPNSDENKGHLSFIGWNIPTMLAAGTVVVLAYLVLRDQGQGQGNTARGGTDCLGCAMGKANHVLDAGHYMRHRR